MDRLKERASATPPPMALASLRLPTLAGVVVVVAILYFAKEVLLPLAIAVLLTFTLAPIVAMLRRAGFPRVLAVITSVAGGFVLIGVFSMIVAYQVSEVAQNITIYQYNIIEKIRTLKVAGSENTLLERINQFAERVGTELNRQEIEPLAAPTEEPKPEPVLVEIFSPRDSIETLENIVGQLIGPLATMGLVVVVVVFMLLEREELRDRFIRLVGYGDLHRTTEALQEAGSRVARYLLTQLLVNVTYGVPLGLGLWFLGIPNAVLWGMLAVVLRFVPYIGPVIAAIFPIFLAFAVAPGWELLLWTIALILIIELISNNVIEPWLYGTRTGLSPLAIIVSAIFWTWLWGPVGLVLSTPLTVCLVVLGRHVPQFEFLEILFGSEPVLDPKERLYQRLLSGDPDEATDNAEEILEEKYLAEYYGSVAIPALLLGEQDRIRGALSDPQLKQVADSARLLVANLEQIANEEEDSDEQVSVEAPDAEKGEAALELPNGEGKYVLCFGGRGVLDDVAAAMLAQVLDVQGAETMALAHSALQPASLAALQLDNTTAIVVNFLNVESARKARFSVRRLKRLHKGARIGLALWGADKEFDLKPIQEETQADFVVRTMSDAVVECLSDAEPKPFIRGQSKVFSPIRAVQKVK